MAIRQYHVDAFADHVFEGNPAAVCILDSWLPDNTLQAIAQENNLSETAFTAPSDHGLQLRWFTPVHEVALCGHATLATAYVLFEILDFPGEKIYFETLSGDLIVSRDEGFLSMDFPSLVPTPCPCPDLLEAGLGKKPLEVYQSNAYIAIFDTEEDVHNLRPDFRILQDLECDVIATAPGHEMDFVSRFFAPNSGIPEDPVTGSAHCMLTPLWNSKNGKEEFRARQVSSRGGNLLCRLNGDRVIIKGKAVLYAEGDLYLDGL